LRSELPHALVLDDGELPDVRAAFASIGVRWADALEDAGQHEVPLLVTTAARAKALVQPGSRPPRHHLHLVVTGPEEGPLVDVPCDFAIRRPVAATLLRLLAERAGYEGPERRRNLRVAIGAPVELRIDGGERRDAILAQVSATGCGLVASAPLEAEQRLLIQVPRELTAPRSLALPGRVLGARRTTTADGATWDVSVAFDPLPIGDRVTLRALMAGQPIDFRPRGGADEAGPTGRPPRRRRFGGAQSNARVAIARGLSARGLRVERDPLLREGDEVIVTLHGGSHVEPATIAARVRADAGGSHWFLAFDALERAEADALARLRDSVAGVAAEGASEPPGFLIAEIRSR
jgi:hypothetical protein